MKANLLSLVLAGLCAWTLGLPAVVALESTAAADEESLPANETAEQNRQRFVKQVKQAKHLPNFHQVHPYLYRGGEPTSAGLEQLKKLGVTTVIDLRSNGEKKINEKAITKELGLEYIEMPMSSKAPTARQVKTFLDKVKGKRDNHDQGSVFVHCAHGSDRTGCLVGIWRVTQDGWNYDQAYKEMRGYWFTPKFTQLSGAVRQNYQKTLSSSGSAAAVKQ